MPKKSIKTKVEVVEAKEPKAKQPKEYKKTRTVEPVEADKDKMKK